MLAAAFAGGINHLLDRAGWARARLAPFAGRRATFAALPWQVCLAITPEGRFSPDPEAERADVVIRLPAGSPVLLLQGIDALMAQAHVEGNAEFATALSFVFRNLRWDVEEDLARFVGDIAAHRVVEAASRCRDATRSGWQRFNENIAEYVAHERAALLGRAEFDGFRDDVARLTLTLDRLERRIPR